MAISGDNTIKIRLWLLRLAVAAIVVVEIEAAAWGLLSLVEARASIHVRMTEAELLAGFDALSQERSFGKRWDPLLGWDYRPNSRIRSMEKGKSRDVTFDADGARSNPMFEGQAPFVAAYGDSFTFGTEVSDDETWPLQMSGLLGRYVANYGVSSYGMDQALLKYKVKHVDKPAAPFVILAIWERNFYRLFYRYRPFCTRGIDAILAFKPMFTLEDGELHLLDNPAREPPLDRIRFLEAVAQAKSGDRWYSRRIDIEFPYSPRLARLATILAADTFDLDLWELGVLPLNLWRSPEAVQLMRAIVDDFLATAASRDARAIILFIPDAPSIRKRHDKRPAYARFVDDLRRDHASDQAIFVDVSETQEEFDPTRFHIRPYLGHPSAFGNLVIARHLVAEMEKRWGRDWMVTAAPQSSP